MQSLLALGSGGIFGVGPRRVAREVLLSARAVHRLHLLGSRRRTRIDRRARRRRALRRSSATVRSRSRSPRRTDSDFSSPSAACAIDRDSGLRQYRRRDVVVAGDRRAAAVHLVRRQLVDRQSRRRRADCQRRPRPAQCSNRERSPERRFRRRRYRRPSLSRDRDRRCASAIARTSRFIGTADRLEATIVPQSRLPAAPCSRSAARGLLRLAPVRQRRRCASALRCAATRYARIWSLQPAATSAFRSSLRRACYGKRTDRSCSSPTRSPD